MSPGSTTASLLSSREWGQFSQHRGEGVVEDPAGSWLLYSSSFLWQLPVADLSRFPQPPPGRGSGILDRFDAHSGDVCEVYSLSWGWGGLRAEFFPQGQGQHSGVPGAETSSSGPAPTNLSGSWGKYPLHPLSHLQALPFLGCLCVSTCV